MIAVNLLQDRASAFICGLLPFPPFVNDFPSLSAKYDKRVTVCGPPQGKESTGKSPLRLITKRTWHSRDSYTDTLECGHESSIQFLDFAWDEQGHVQAVQPTAKRRRCQQCKKENVCTSTKVSSRDYSLLDSMRRLASGFQRVTTTNATMQPNAAITSTEPRQIATRPKPSKATTVTDNLYESALRSLKKPSRKSA